MSEVHKALEREASLSMFGKKRPLPEGMLDADGGDYGRMFAMPEMSKAAKARRRAALADKYEMPSEEPQGKDDDWENINDPSRNA